MVLALYSSTKHKPLLSVNEEDFFEEDVLETDDETMWAPYFREEEQGEDRRSYRNTSTRITRNNARNLHEVCKKIAQFLRVLYTF